MKQLIIKKKWISSSEFLNLLYDITSVSIELAVFRMVLFKLRYIEPYRHAKTQDLLYRATDLGLSGGIKTKEMLIRPGKYQTGILVNQLGINNIIEKLKREGLLPVQEDMNIPNNDSVNAVSAESLSPINILKAYIGVNAQFREGQLEAINRVVKGDRVLVVQRTGWGKSVVYFIGTKILRLKGYGPALIISPLLSLMRNQIESASKLGLEIRTINSSNKDEHSRILQELKENRIDILMIAPEQLANQSRFDQIHKNVRSIGFFVVDEAHCISDWGHDFRPDYRRIVDYVNILPANIPILATTATANDRVIIDISSQLGNISVIRGPLTRPSLRLKTIKIKDEVERLVWLEQNIPHIPGSGIIYCLTIRSTERVASYLRSCGIDAHEYHSQIGDKERIQLESDFYCNKLKCLVATIALGMGYDKPDISFIVHYQRPGNLISYYQQIGRAGRNIDEAKIVLLCGQEDDEIQQYFIDSAFPTENEMIEVVTKISKSNGIRLTQLSRSVNITEKRLKDCLTYLQVEKVIFKDNSGSFIRTLNPWNPNDQRSREITERKMLELNQIKEYTDYSGCLMEFISSALDDPFSQPCGKCMNCDPNYKTSDLLIHENIHKAQRYVRGEVISIQPRKRYPFSVNESTIIPVELQFREGRTLCIYGEVGLGRMIAEDKYKRGFIRNELVEASYECLQNWQDLPRQDLCICFVPSVRRPEFVRSFATRLSELLGIPVFDAVYKSHTGPSQKSLLNGSMQFENAMNQFEVRENIGLSRNILLIDDIVDSRWTFTAISIKLRQSYNCEVYPFTIANSNGKVTEKDV